MHHICIGGNVPLRQFVELLADIAESGVVEWVDKADVMVQRLLRNRKDVFDDYRWATFRSLLEERFVLAQTLEAHDGNRRLCLVLPKAG